MRSSSGLRGAGTLGARHALPDGMYHPDHGDEQDAAPPRPDRLARLPEQHFVALRGLVEAAAGDRWRAAHRLEPRQSRGRAAAACGRRPLRRGAATDRSWVRVAPGLPELKEALAERYRSLYGVELDPEREVAVVPGTKTAVAELTLVLADGGRKGGAP